MRRAIDNAPRDGKFVVLEDDVSGTFEFAQWSAEARAWIRENGELSQIKPTYWHKTQFDDLLQEGDEFILQKESGLSGPSTSSTRLPAPQRDDFLMQEGDESILPRGWGSSGSSASREPRPLLFPSGQAAPLQLVATAADIPFGQVADPFTVDQLNAWAAQDKSEQSSRGRRWFVVSSIAATLVAASLIGLYFRTELAAYVARYTGEQENVRIGKIGVGVVEQETQLPGQDLQRADSLARDPAPHRQAERANAQPSLDSTQQIKQGSEATRPEAQQLLEKERQRADALANELAKAQQVVETQVALANKARDQAVRLGQSAETGMAELRLSLQKEREKAEALAGELAKARQDIETQLPSKGRDQAAQLKQVEKVNSSLRQSLKTEHDRAEALASELTTARTSIYAYEAQARKTSDQAANLKQAAENAAPELQKTLQLERERAVQLEQDLAAARRDGETQVALSSKKAEEVLQLQRATESAIAELRQSLKQEHNRAEALSSELARAQQDSERQFALSSKTGAEAAQVKKAAESTTAELRQSLKQEHDRAEALASELGAARTTITAYEDQARKTSDQAADLKQTAESVALELQKPLQQERERAARLEQELAAARRDNENQIALATKTGDEAAQVKMAAESTTAELRQSLKQEHDRAEALASELGTARTAINAHEAQARKTNDQATDLKLELQKSLQQERERTARLELDLAAARRDVETQVALSTKRAEELAQLKKAADNTKADLRLSLQHERERAPVREPTQPPNGARNVVERESNSQTLQVIQTGRTAATEQPAVAEAQGSPEAARLLARAGALLRQGDIGAARTVLERAVETGSAQASFMLAETYDPFVLSTWKTYGTHGDVTKARELYAKALAGGIQEAKDRSVALR